MTRGHCPSTASPPDAVLILSGPIKGSAKALMKYRHLPLTPSQRLDNLINRFRRLHSEKLNGDAYKELVMAMKDAEATIQSLEDDLNYLSKQLALLDVPQLEALNDTCKGSTEGGSSLAANKKLPLIMRGMMPLIDRLIGHKDAIKSLGDQVLESATTSCIRKYHTLKGSTEAFRGLQQSNQHPKTSFNTQQMCFKHNNSLFQKYQQSVSKPKSHSKTPVLSVSNIKTICFKNIHTLFQI